MVGEGAEVSEDDGPLLESEALGTRDGEDEPERHDTEVTEGTTAGTGASGSWMACSGEELAGSVGATCRRMSGLAWRLASDVPTLGWSLRCAGLIAMRAPMGRSDRGWRLSPERREMTPSEMCRWRSALCSTGVDEVSGDEGVAR